MVKSFSNQYNPDFVSAPGETLLEALETLGMSQAELADRTGCSKKRINEIIKGKAPITPRMAIELERVLGVATSFWNNRESQYRESLAKNEEQDRLKEEMEWLKQFPISIMQKNGWIKKRVDKIKQIQEILSFLGLASPAQWPKLMKNLQEQVIFRKSQKFDSDIAALIVWLRIGELEAKNIDCKPFDERKFRKKLVELRTLTRSSPEKFHPALIEKCASCGIAVVFVPELPKTRVSGATRWLTSDKALIQLSLRYKTDDHLWFSFFHEVGHILLHGKKAVFVEEPNTKMNDPKEEEANKFAGNILISASEYRLFKNRGELSKFAISTFAQRSGVADGIVVGRLQYDGIIPQSNCNDLKQRLCWTKN